MIATVMLYAILSLFISFTYFKVCFHNMKQGAVNGFGSLQATLQEKNCCPAQFRPLTAWLWAVMVKMLDLKGKHTHSLAYEPIRVASIFAATISTHLFLSLYLTPLQTITAVLLMMLLFCASFKFDYTDNYIDLAIFMMFGYIMHQQVMFSGVVMAILVFVGSVNRESAALLPAWYLIHSHDIVAAILLALAYTTGRLMLFRLYGHRRHYADVWNEYDAHCFGDKKLNHGRFNWRENLREILFCINPFKQLKRTDSIPIYSEYLFSLAYLIMAAILIWQVGWDAIAFKPFAVITGLQLLHTLPVGCFNEFRILTFSYPLFGYLAILSLGG